MIFSFKKREQKIENKEREIQAIKQMYHKDMNETIDLQKEINKVLSNGVTLKVYYSTGHKK